jgi:beta-lactamase regulating signal transducer with metallopeptidase domain
METILHFASASSPAAVSALFSSLWEGLILAACVAVTLRLIPGISASSRSLVWLNVFLLITLLHVVPSLHPAAVFARSAVPTPSSLAPIQLDLRWSLAIGALWFLLSLARALQLIVSAVRLRGLVRRATPIEPDPALRPLLQTQSPNGKPARAVLLCTSAEVERPSVSGFFRPRILLPPELLAELSASELQQVVIHEMEHLHRHDDWTNLLQKICLVLFPINPVLLWVERRLCAERELACDDSVLRSSCGRKAYALCLTHLAEHTMLRRGFSLVLGAWERQSELVRRVHRILRRPVDSMSSKQAAVVTATLLVAVLTGTAALARSPQLVTFTAPAQPTLQAGDIQPAAPAGNIPQHARLNQNEPTAQLVKAVMPSQSTPPALSKKPARINHSRPTAQPNYTQNQQTFVVLTEWTETEAPPRVVFAVDQMNRIRYAAVPTPNGWLVIQI